MPKLKSNNLSDIGKSIHPKSRKAKQLSKKLTREAKMKKKRKFVNMKQQVLREKLIWFKENMNVQKESYSPNELESLVQKYINRNSEELNQIKQKQKIGHRNSRQNASREDLVTICKENETQEFLHSGFEVIDLVDAENFTQFKSWNGEMRLISNFKLRKILKGENEEIPLLPQNNNKMDVT